MTWLSFLLTLSIFTPSQPSVPEYKFAVIGDTQINQKIFRRAIKDIKTRKLDFVVHVGDIYWCQSIWQWRWYRKYMRTTKIPWHVVIGNHEIMKCNRHSRPTKYRWRRFWRRKGLKHDTYKAFSVRGHRYILLDSSSGGTTISHLNKLTKELKAANNKSVFLFSHKPLPYNKGRMRIYYGPQKKYWHYYWAMAGLGWFSTNKTLWRTVYKYRNKVNSFFHGHYHAFRRYSLAGIPVYCTGGGGGKLETRHDFYHYLVVSVKENKHSIKVVRLWKP